MAFITKDRTFYKLIAKIAIPISLQNLITFLVGMMDTVMLGTLGEVELSASALANQLFFIFMITSFGLSNGANILIAQYWGKGETGTIRKICSITYKLNMALAVVFTLVALLLPGQVLSIFTQDAAVIEQGIHYLRIVAVSFLFYGVSCPTVMMLRAVQTVHISLAVYSTSLVVNVFFNWVFIFGNLGAPRMGVAGAALATAIARGAELAVALFYMARREQKICMKWQDIRGFDRALLPDFFSYVLPVTFNEILWSTGAAMISVIVGRMGTEYVAANSISGVLNQLVTVVIFGMSSSAAVIIGNTVGMGDIAKTRERAHTFIALGLVMGLLAGVMTLLVRPYVVAFYNVSDTTKGIAMQIMAAGALIVFFQSIAATSMMGVLRGGGDGKFVMFADVIFLWTVAVPLGAVCALVLHLPVWMVFLALKCDELLKSVVALWRLSGDKWLRDVTR